MILWVSIGSATFAAALAVLFVYAWTVQAVARAPIREMEALAAARPRRKHRLPRSPRHRVRD
jgi:membrane protein implicated in regulation of membrane protease activity